MILADGRWRDAGWRWRQAEEFGFDHAWTYDHLGWRDLVDGPWFDAVPTLAAAATQTSRIRLGTFVASPNFRHPVSFARELTALDDLSAGRLLVGVGAGGTGFDDTVLGTPALSPRQRVDRFAEFLDLLDALLRAGPGNTPVNFAGRYYQAVAARSTPGCVQAPRVPFVVAGNGRRSVALAARFGQGWVTTGPAAETLDEWWRGVARLAATFAEAQAEAGRDGLARYLSLDAAPVYSLSSVDTFVDAVERAAELGFTDVVTHWPRAESWYAGSQRVLEAVARDILPGLR